MGKLKALFLSYISMQNKVSMHVFDKDINDESRKLCKNIKIVVYRFVYCCPVLGHIKCQQLKF